MLLYGKNTAVTMDGGSIVTANNVMNEDLIFIRPKSKRIKFFKKLQKPESKEDFQNLVSMLVSFHAIGDSSMPLEIPIIRKATASQCR